MPLVSSEWWEGRRRLRDSQSQESYQRYLEIKIEFFFFFRICFYWLQFSVCTSLLKKNRKVSCQWDGKREQKQEEYAAVNSNSSLTESSLTALWTLLQILGKILVKHEHMQQWFCSMGFKEAAYHGCGLEAMLRFPSLPGESLLSGELSRLIPVLNTPL